MIICHVSPLHSRYDTRIFLKQSVFTAKLGHKVYYIVSDGLLSEKKYDVNIINVDKKRSLINRLIITHFKFLIFVLNTKPSVVHFHDPEMLVCGLILRIFGNKVIYDMHEDFPKQILGKEYIHKYLRSIISKLASLIENITLMYYSGITSATESIQNKNKKYKNILLLPNYPILGELENRSCTGEIKNQVCFIGGITAKRGILEVIQSLELLNEYNIRLQLAGKFSSVELYEKAKALNGWKHVDYHNQVNRETVAKIMNECIAGIVTFLPAPNHVDSQPNKMYEYMSAGLPVICSDFELWKSTILDNDCGLCVNPNSPVEIANAIKYLLINKDIRSKICSNAINIIHTNYNWDTYFINLVDFYKKIKIIK
jgi:glycosyltransferase involved in cell wall biosynthesis